MSLLSSLFRNLTRRGNVERDLAAEVDSYVDLSTQRKVKSGLSEPEARREALVELGGRGAGKRAGPRGETWPFPRDTNAGRTLRLSQSYE